MIQQAAPLSTPADPIDAATHLDPSDYYAHLAEERPFYHDRALGAWVASSAAAVAEVLGHPACRVRPESEPVPLALAGTPAGEIFRHLVRMTDGEAHCPLKHAITSTLDALDPHRAVEVSARWAERLARGIGPASDAAELMKFAYTLSPYIVGSLLGIADMALADVADDVGQVVRCIFPGGTADQIERGIHAAARLDERFRAALTEASEDTLLGRLAAGMRQVGIVSPDVVIANAIGFLAQGYDGTAGLIANTLLALARAPEMCAGVADAPELLAGIVADVLRREPTFQNTRRFVAEPTLIAGQQLQADDVILVLLVAANNDPASAPASAMGSDATASTSFAFGAGLHACPGSSLAQTIATAAVARLLANGVDPARLDPHPLYRPSPNARVPILAWRDEAPDAEAQR
ncbi:MAG TPA: hypothetical protein VFE05_09055 [Longimicrobiaceae bacterium]|jgi:cytochrome P450|nr:hypothetical protein [Longimicrobiaceae bacterium]